jgi:hypothetical protein
MRAGTDPFLKRTAVLASIAILTSGCAGLPSAGGVTTLSLHVGSARLVGPVVAVDGESGMGPGKAARAALPKKEMCDSVLAIVCAVMIPVAVPVAAIVGAAAKTSQKLPLEQALELNRVSADVSSQLDLAAAFSTAVHAEAQHRGITLTARNPGGQVLVVPRALSWDIKAGNKVAVRMEIDVTVLLGGGSGTSQVTYRSRSAKVADWIADDGQLIRESLEEAMVGASQLVWARILGAT